MEYDRSDQVRRIVEEHSVTTIEEVADIMVMNEDEIRDYVDDLKNRGDFTERDGKLRPT